MSCDAKIRPFPDNTEIVCELDGDHETHEATLKDYAYSGSQTKLKWLETDRRTYHGEWPGRCFGGCPLPIGHRGNHA